MACDTVTNLGSRAAPFPTPYDSIGNWTRRIETSYSPSHPYLGSTPVVTYRTIRNH